MRFLTISFTPPPPPHHASQGLERMLTRGLRRYKSTAGWLPQTPLLRFIVEGAQAPVCTMNLNGLRHKTSQEFEAVQPPKREWREAAVCAAIHLRDPSTLRKLYAGLGCVVVGVVAVGSGG